MRQVRTELWTELRIVNSEATIGRDVNIGSQVLPAPRDEAGSLDLRQAVFAVNGRRRWRWRRRPSVVRRTVVLSTTVEVAAFKPRRFRCWDSRRAVMLPCCALFLFLFSLRPFT